MKEKFKTKKAKILIGILFGILIILIGILVYLQYLEKQEKEMIKEIKTYYNDYVITSRNTKIYNKNNKKIGIIKKNFILKLEKKRINTSKDQYFKIESKDFYVYYKDLKKTEKKENVKNNHYIVFNQNLESNEIISFYKNDKEVLKVKDKFNLPIEYMDDKYYYVNYLNEILGIRKDDKLKLVNKENTTDKESEYISIINYDNIYKDENCNNDTCIDFDKVKEQLNYLKENNFYTITLDEYRNWLDGKIRLKEKAILLTTPNNNQNVIDLNNEFALKLEILTNVQDLKFVDANNKTTKESKKDNLSRYVIKNKTSLDDFKRMSAGEEVKEPVTKTEKVVSNANGQKIPVLNYHFFYDPALGESCNENICLEVSVFRQQLDYLKNNGYKTLTMDEFTKWMYGQIELPAKSVLITIDDGAMGTGNHNGNKLIPILEEYNMHATLFLISGWWDVNNYRSKNLDIQSHTYDMHQYGNCGKGQVVCATKEELVNDLKKSLAIVDNNNSFCFPFYSYSDVAIEGVKEAGFKMSFIGGYRKASRNDDKYKIPRYPIHKTTTMNQFIQMVN